MDAHTCKGNTRRKTKNKQLPLEEGEDINNNFSTYAP